MQAVSLKAFPEFKENAVTYFQTAWPEVLPVIYEDCILHGLSVDQKLPQWYLLKEGNGFIGCAGLITNDFISRMDLYPWLCAMYIDPDFRGNNYGSLLIEKVKHDTKKIGFDYLYLCTDHIGYYEKFEFQYIGQGFHPWGEESRIYQTSVL